MGDTLASNIYLGDVSSEIWEFIMNPRPCVFANTHKVAWDKDPNYLDWHKGLVFDDIQDLHSCLECAILTHGTYLARQVELFKYTFDITEEPSSRRAANAILQFMNIIV